MVDEEEVKITAGVVITAGEFDFDLEPISIPFTVKGKDGTLYEYTLEEAMGSDRDGYLNNLGARMKLDSEGKPAGIKNFDGLQANLLCRLIRDRERKLVSEAIIQSWPSRIQSKLFKKAKEISGLDDQAEPNAKKD